MSEKRLETIIVLRNGTKEAWEADDSYILLTGEVGVGYMDVMAENGSTVAKTVPIIKVGDGETAWKDLPQAEGVFEKDVVLTSTFGKYTPSNGYVKVPNSKGMTTSEFLMDALSEVKEPTINAPTFTLSATGLGEKELGTVISSVAWTGTFNNGYYQYGSKVGDTVHTATTSNQSATGYAVTCTPAEGTGIVVDTVEQKEDGKATFSTSYTVNSTSAVTLASVTSTCSWGASDRDPVNNVGEITKGKLAAGSSTETVSYSVSGYRKMFIGISDTDATVANTQLTSDFVRGLSTVSVKAAKTSKEFSVPAGKKYFYVAIPKSLTTTTPDVYYKPFSNWEAFSTVEDLGEVDVEGASGYTAAAYKVYRGYSETGKFESATSIKVTIK